MLRLGDRRDPSASLLQKVGAGEQVPLVSRTPMIVRTYEPRDRDCGNPVVASVRLIVPQNDPGRDINRKGAEQPVLFFVGESDVTTAMAGYDGHLGWINQVGGNAK